MGDMTNNERIIITHDHFLNLVDILVEKIIRYNEFTYHSASVLYGIPRGGLVPAVYLSHRLNERGYSFRIASTEQQAVDFMKQRFKVVFVDDINDSGNTLLKAYLDSNNTVADDCFLTATLISNIESMFLPTFSAWDIRRSTIPQWFIFPWETPNSTKTSGV